jgi:pimeloyl-ACP methyl ester carboxylesterase
MRARYPDTGGFIERGGVKVGYEVFGAGEPAILLLTPWAIVHARQWKAQVPYLARRFRVIAVEGRGNGRAGRPATAEDYSDREYVDDAIAVLDAAGLDRAVVVDLSLGGRHALQLAAWYPERAAGVIAIGAALPWPVPPDFDEPKDSYQGWGKANQHYWLAGYRGWAAAGRSRPGSACSVSSTRNTGAACIGTHYRSDERAVKSRNWRCSGHQRSVRR